MQGPNRLLFTGQTDTVQISQQLDQKMFVKAARKANGWPNRMASYRKPEDYGFGVDGEKPASLAATVAVYNNHQVNNMKRSLCISQF